jgi:predicted SAM-dependent methyltransferase
MPELLIGCGNARNKQLARPGRKAWSDLVTLDLDPACKPDVVHDLNQLPYPFEDNQFDEIHACHVLEHCGRQGDWRFFFKQCEEFWRITKPGGTFHGICRHRNSVWAWG